MGEIFPFRRKKDRMAWLQGVTPRKRKWPFPPATAAVGLVIGIGMAVAAIYFPIPTHSPATAQTFSLCYTGGGTNCVVDGDTFWNNGMDIRVADIDAPETHPARCQKEADLGRRATLRFQELLNAGAFTLRSIERDHDQYGRKLRVVMRDGRSLGMQLVAEGLARPWGGGRKPWCE
jgi:micrococcal nuclease